MIERTNLTEELERNKRTLHLGPHLILFHAHPEVVRQLVGEDGQQEDLSDGAAEGLVEGLVLSSERNEGIS